MLLAQAPTGDIAGIVYDPSGAVLAKAPVTITDKGTRLERSVTTNENGYFAAGSLSAGVYAVRVSAPGFRTIERDATVATGAVTTVDLHLEMGETREVVHVESVAPQIEYERHTIDGVVTRQQIQNLPLNGRSFLQLAFLEPGVTVSANNQGQYNRAFDVSVLGGDSSTTRITVDGAIINDPVDGGTEQNFSQEIVQEFQVSSVNFDLSTGIAAGGAVNVVTRSGSNQFHGSGYFFFRDHNMSAYPALQRDPNNPDPFFARRQPGFWLGGPIKKDRLFFFTNYEHNNQRGVFSTIPSDPTFRNLGTVSTSPYNGNQVSARLDYRITDRHSAFVRYSHDGNNSFAPRGSGLPSTWVSNTNWADSGVLSLISAFTSNLVNEARFSETFWRNNNTIPTAAQCPDCLGLGGPHISIEGTGFSIGNQTNTPQSRLLRRYIYADNVTLQHGNHRFKFGGEWEYQYGVGTYTVDSPADVTLFSPAEVMQFAPALVPFLPKSFNSMTDILRLPLKSFSFGLGDINQPPPFQRGNADHNNRFHFYWQDSWKLKPRFTLNYGLGYSYESNLLNHDLVKPRWLTPLVGANGLGNEYHAPLHFSPMLGFAWAVTKDNKTVVRGGAGIYYDTIDLELRLIERAYIGPLGAGYVVLPGSLIPNPIPGIPGVKQGTPLEFNAPTAFSGNALMAILPAVRATTAGQLHINPNNKDLSVTTIDLFKTGTELFARDFVPPYAQHASIGIQRQVTSDFTISADFVYRHFLHQTLRDLDVNRYDRFVNGQRTPVIPVCPAALTLAPGAPCSNGAVEEIFSGGRTTYKALLLKGDKRFARRYQMQVSYAYQDQRGINGIYNLDNWFEYTGPQGPKSILNVSGMVDLPWKFQVSFISTYSSRSAFQPVIPGVDLTGSGISGFPLPGMGGELFNAGLGKGDLVRLVNQYNQSYAGKPGPNPSQTFPLVTLPANYDFGRNFNSQDVRLTKFFRWAERYELQVFVEGFNVFNVANLGGYSNNLLNPAFGEPTSRAGNIFGTGGPRAFQVGSRFSF